MRATIWVVGGVIAIVVMIATRNFVGVFAAPIAWFIGFYSSSVYYPEPALDEWDKLPKETRIGLIRAGNSQAWHLASFDKDMEVRGLPRKLTREMKNGT